MSAERDLLLAIFEGCYFDWNDEDVEFPWLVVDGRIDITPEQVRLIEELMADE